MPLACIIGLGPEELVCLGGYSPKLDPANIAIIGLRAWELLVSLNVKWETNAYGSVQWLVLGAHATLLAVELVEIGGMMLIFWFAPVEEKHMSDVADMVFYWYFMVLSWLPLYVLCFWLPRWL